MLNNENTKRKGAASPKTTPKDTTKKIKFTDNSTQNQHLKLLDYLLEHNSITTSKALEKLDIMSSAMRISQLKAKGYLINTIPAIWISDFGINHKGVARYVLTQKQPLETINKSEVRMSYAQLFNRAYALFVKCNSHAIAHNLAYMTESELLGVIAFLTQLQGC